MMTNEQTMSLVRDVLKIGGTVALLAGISQGTVDTWTSIILTVAGPLMSIGAIVWSQLGSTRSGVISKASALPEVTEITVTAPALARAAKEADPTTRVQVKPPAF